MRALQWVRSLLFSAQATIAMPIIGLAYAPMAMFSKEWAYAACRAYAGYVIWSARWLIGLRCEVRGEVPSGEALIAAKHQSFLDILMIFHALPRAKFIMKKQIHWTPVIGQYAKRMEMIAVDRGKRGKAIAKMVEDVHAGRREPGQLVIYSQGTRVKPGLSAPYKSARRCCMNNWARSVCPWRQMRVCSGPGAGFTAARAGGGRIPRTDRAGTGQDGVHGDAGSAGRGAFERAAGRGECHAGCVRSRRYRTSKLFTARRDQPRSARSRTA